MHTVPVDPRHTPEANASRSKALQGNQNGFKGREWTEAIRHALLTYENEHVKRKQALSKIATKVVEKALEGDKDSWQEIGNRLDGKPAQSVDISGLVTIERVDRVIIDAITQAQDVELINGPEQSEP